jgi:ribokinase
MSPRAPSGRVAIIGHVEWVTHAMGRFPSPGGIADLSEPFSEPAGGGGVAACAAARLGAPTTLITALGDDQAARDSEAILRQRGIHLVVAPRQAPQTPALSVCDPGGDRTIVVVGPRLQARGDDMLDWGGIDPAGAAYYAGEDIGALVHARAAGALVVTARRRDDLITARVRADVVVGSASDPDEDLRGFPSAIAPRYRVITDGPRGGTVIRDDGAEEHFPPVAPSAAPRDAYGCGDTFAAGLVVGLARGLDIAQAVRLGAAAGAECTTWRGGIGPAA